MPQGILIKGVIDMIYNALIYYKNDNFVPGAINFLAEKFNKYPNLKFKGSSNQRILDVKSSLKTHKLIEFPV